MNEITTAPVGIINPINGSPDLNITPVTWWKQSFQNGIFRHLVVAPDEKSYGPFYKVSPRNDFEPKIGDPDDPKSEIDCFWGIENPRTIRQARILYFLEDLGIKYKYVHEFKFSIRSVQEGMKPILFFGPVKNGYSYQFCPNRDLVTLMKKTIEIKTMELNGSDFSSKEEFNSQLPRETD